MSIWASLSSVLNQAQMGAFGEPVLYQTAADAALDNPPPPIAVTVERQTRDQTESLANYERVWGTVGSASGQFPAAPAKGDFMTIGGTDYVIFQAKPDEDPGSDGYRIYLAKRNPNHV